MSEYRTLDEARARVEAWCAEHDVDAVDTAHTVTGNPSLSLARGDAIGEIKFGALRWLHMANALDADGGRQALDVIGCHEEVYGLSPREYGEALA